VPEPPAATSAPSVAGTARRGQTLTVRVGAWTNAPTGYAYQWQRLVPNGWEDIDGATGVTYVARTEDLGRRLRVTVVASNQDGSASAASAPSAVVGATGLNRAASQTSRKGKRIQAKASKKKKAAAKKKQAAKRKKATRVRV
jgi:hypothetical protein